MDIYHYHPQTGELVGKGRADADPVEKGNWLIPANSTRLKPPATSENQAVIFIGDRWQIVPDYRMQTFYFSDGTEYHGRLNEALPDDVTETKPEPVYSIEELIDQNNQKRRYEYEKHVDPLLMEAAIKRAQGNDIEAQQLTEKALAERERIQAVYLAPEGN